MTAERVGWGLGAGVTALVYWLRLDHAAGLFKDDGWYIVMAKAIATGHDLTLINFSQQGAVYFYPPGFPLLLSSVFLLGPDFPGNVWLLKSFSIVAMAMAGWMTYRLLSLKELVTPNLAALIAFCVVLVPSWVFLATSTVMSECVYFALQMAALWAAERRVVSGGWTTKAVVSVAALAAAGFLMRSAGSVVLVAVGAYLLKERLFKPALTFAVVAALLISPWLLYKQHLLASAPASIQSQLPQGYRQQLSQRSAGTNAQATVDVQAFSQRLWQNTMVIIAADAGALFLPVLFRTRAESGEELLELTNVAWVPRDFVGWGKGTMGNAVGTKIVSAAASIGILVGFILASRVRVGLLEIFSLLFLATVVIWPGPTFRYLLPLSPLLFYYFAIGWKRLLSLLRPGPSESWMFAHAALFCILAFYLYDHAGYLSARRLPLTAVAHPEWLRRFEATKEAAAWIRANTPAEEVVTGDNIPMTYLYSGRRTDMCAIQQCRGRGIRYYLRQQDIFDFPAEDVRFQSPFHNQVRVVELREQLPKD